MLHEVDIKTAVDAISEGKQVLAMVDLGGDEYDIQSLQKFLESARFLVDEQEVGLPVPKKEQPGEEPAADQTEVEPEQTTPKPEQKTSKRDAIRAKLPEIKTMLDDGMSQRYIAKQLGFDQAELSKVLAENNIKTVKKKDCATCKYRGADKEQDRKRNGNCAYILITGRCRDKAAPGMCGSYEKGDRLKPTVYGATET